MSDKDNTFFPNITHFGNVEEEIRKLHERINRLDLRVSNLERIKQ